MTANLTPYLHFSGNAREAMGFYASVFGGEPEFLTFEAAQMSGQPEGAIMHSFLRGDNGFELMGSDLPEGVAGFERYHQNGNVTLSLSGDDEALLTSYWQQLSAGGEVGQELQTSPWGDSYGDFIDRFGIRWLVNISTSRE